ncbi:MAG: hypothetical protein AB8F74_13420 [Saprospiraceae bacterium]
MRNIIYLSLIVATLLSACAKEELVLDPIQDEPLFKVDVNKNNESFLIEAGRNDFYLFTDYTLGQSADNFSPLSEFAKLEDCSSDCTEAFNIEIHNVSVEERENFFGENWEASNFALKSNSDPLGNVSFSYTDAAGVTYSSNLGEQSNSAFFKVTNIQSYLKNEKNQDTKLMYAELDCELYDNSGNSISFSNGELVFAVAIL